MRSTLARPYARSARSTAPAGSLRGSEREGVQPSPLPGSSRPVSRRRELLDIIAGVGGPLAARGIVSEIGIDQPLPHQRIPHLVRRHVPQERRVRRQAPLQPPARGCPLAHDHAGIRMGRQCAGKATMFAPHGAGIQTVAEPEGYPGGRRFHPHRRLSHAQGRHPYRDRGARHLEQRDSQARPSDPSHAFTVSDISPGSHRTRHDRTRASSERKAGLALVTARPLSVSRNSLDRRLTGLRESRPTPGQARAVERGIPTM